MAQVELCVAVKYLPGPKADLVKGYRHRREHAINMLLRDLVKLKVPEPSKLNIKFDPSPAIVRCTWTAREHDSLYIRLKATFPLPEKDLRTYAMESTDLYITHTDLPKPLSNPIVKSQAVSQLAPDREPPMLPRTLKGSSTSKNSPRKPCGSFDSLSKPVSMSDIEDRKTIPTAPKALRDSLRHSSFLGAETPPASSAFSNESVSMSLNVQSRPPKRSFSPPRLCETPPPKRVRTTRDVTPIRHNPRRDEDTMSCTTASSSLDVLFSPLFSPQPGTLSTPPTPALQLESETSWQSPLKREPDDIRNDDAPSENLILSQLASVQDRLDHDIAEEHRLLLQLRVPGNSDASHGLSIYETQDRLRIERRKRRIAEQLHLDVEQECREPFVVPALLEAFGLVSHASRTHALR